MNKYHAKKISTPDGTFDSKHEYERWCELKLLARAGKIQNLEKQVPFELVPAQYETYDRVGKTGKPLKSGKRCIEKSVVYKADFVYQMDGETVVEDAKGVKTKEYIIKRKLMLYVHGIRVHEV